MKKPFEGCKIYWSGPISAGSERDPDFAWKLTEYLLDSGAEILNRYIAARNKEEMFEMHVEKLGVTVKDLHTQPYPWFGIRKRDIAWVEEATHLIALVNVPSHGVGIEIEHALLKPRIGLNKTPILCLIHKDNLENLSFMIRGISEKDKNKFCLGVYTDLEEAKKLVFQFLKKTNYGA